MAFVTLDPPRARHQAAHEAMPWTLLRTVATVQLYLEERWVEPAGTRSRPMSLLVHQTMMLLEQSGGLRPPDLARAVLGLPPLSRVPRPTYASLLRALVEGGMIELAEDGTLIPGVEGGRFVHDWTSLAVFRGSQEIQVMHGTEAIGSLTDPPAAGDVIGLAGRSWRVLSVDEQAACAWVAPSRKRRTTTWRTEGTAQVHARVTGRMRGLLADTGLPAYLRPSARERLTRARELAASSGLVARDLHALAPGVTLLTPWAGTRAQLGLMHLLRHASRARELPQPEEAPGYGVRIALSERALRRLIDELPEQAQIDAAVHASLCISPPAADKLDHLVPPALLADAFLEDSVDLAGARRWLEGL